MQVELHDRLVLDSVNQHAQGSRQSLLSRHEHVAEVDVADLVRTTLTDRFADYLARLEIV